MRSKPIGDLNANRYFKKLMEEWTCLNCGESLRNHLKYKVCMFVPGQLYRAKRHITLTRLHTAMVRLGHYMTPSGFDEYEDFFELYGLLRHPTELKCIGCKRTIKVMMTNQMGLRLRIYRHNKPGTKEQCPRFYGKGWCS